MLSNEAEMNLWDKEPVSSLIQKVHFKHLTTGLRSLSVLSEKKGEGKTTLALSIAKGLTNVYQLKTLVVDLNPEGDTLLNNILKGYEFNKSKSGIVDQHPFDFDLFRIKNVDIDWLNQSYDTLYINQLISVLMNDYDVVIVDSMSSDGIEARSIKASTHSNLVVTSSKSFGPFKLKLESDLINNKKDVLGVVFNK